MKSLLNPVLALVLHVAARNIIKPGQQRSPERIQPQPAFQRNLFLSQRLSGSIASGSNKGAALASLVTSLGFSLADCMAFSDAMNDREMLESVGQGFIMGNAMSQLKSLLPHLPIIGHCENQGVSHFLNHWLFTPDLDYSPEN